MSTTFKPFGLKPAYHPSGLDRSVPFIGTNSFSGTDTFNAPYSLGVGESFYQYQPVGLNSSGQLTIAATSAATSPVYGVFDGVEFTDAQGRRSVGKGISGTALASCSQVIFWIFQDPSLVYEAQVNGSASTASIGKQYDFDGTSGSTTVDGITIGNGGAMFSTTALASSASSSQGQVRVVGLGREAAFPAGETNAWGDDYTIVQVQIANNAFLAPKAPL